MKQQLPLIKLQLSIMLSIIYCTLFLGCKTITYKYHFLNDPKQPIVAIEKYRVKGRDTVPFGWWSEYYSDGSISRRAKYDRIDGKLRPRKIIYYHNNGNVAEKVRGKNGRQAGIGRQYYPNGQLAMKAHYKNDSKFGTAKYFYENGKIKAKGRHGGIAIAVKIDSVGNITPDTIWHNQASLIGVWKYYYPNGQLKESGRYLPYILRKEIPTVDTLSLNLIETTPRTETILFKTAEWKYWSESGGFLKSEFYDDRGKLLRTDSIK